MQDMFGICRYSGRYADMALFHLAGIVGVGKTVHFEFKDNLGSSMCFSCEQKYTEEDAQRLESEREKQKS